MNKTIIINISGMVFHIDEDAYEILRSYMIEVKKHFGHSADSHEIVVDIENRIAEMFTERIGADKKEVITMQDVQEVIDLMGRVSEFDEGTEEQPNYGEPVVEVYETVQRKFMRDPDDRVFGGVASGIGLYFGIEARWIRLVFILLFLTAGSGLIFYLILWIVVPVAKTRADRMAMRGEAPNIRNFKRSFDEEMEGLRSNFTDAGGSARTALHSAGDFLTAAVVVVAKFIGVLFILGICGALITLVVSIFATFGFLGSTNDMAMFPFRVIPNEYFNTLLISALFVAIIPLVALIGLIIRILFNRHLIGRYTGFILLALWLTAVGLTTHYAVETGNDFREESTIVEERSLELQPTYHLTLKDVSIIHLNDSVQLEDRSGYIRRAAENRSSLSANIYKNAFTRVGVSLAIAKIDSAAQPSITYEYSAHGRTFEQAAERAGKIEHNLTQNGEVIIIDSHFKLGHDELFRDQDVHMRLNIPVGTIVYLDRDLQRILRNVSIRQCRTNYEARDGFAPDKTAWIMTEAGLKCTVDEPEPEAEETEVPNPVILN